MSIRNLDYLFKPRSIALLGASKEPSAIGAVIARNLLKSGFRGPVMPVTPEHRAIEGVLAYPDVAALPVVPDLAVLATPPETIPGLIDELGQRGTRAAVVLAAGFGEPGDASKQALRQAILDAARPHAVRIVGPNCSGVLAPPVGLNCSLAATVPGPGKLAFVAQSGAIGSSVLDWAGSRGIGFSHFASLGEMIDVDFGDLLDYFAGEAEVRGILLYMEAVGDTRKFMSAARSTARLKPVVVVKAGRQAGAAAAVVRHTGAPAGDDAVYDAAIRRAGMLRVFDIGDLFGAVETLALGRTAPGDRLAILTNGGALGVLAADALIDAGGRLAELAPESADSLRRSLPGNWAAGNPVDMAGDAAAERYGRALKVLLADPGNDAVLVMHAPNALVDGRAVARAVVNAAQGSTRCMLTCWLGETAPRGARQFFAEQRLPTFYTPERAVRAFMQMVNYRRNQALLAQTPPSIPEDFRPDAAAAQRIVAAALAEGRPVLTGGETARVLTAYGLPVAGAGGLLDGNAAASAGAATLGNPRAFELQVTVTEDARFGPVIRFGHGGAAADIIGDTAVALPPLNMYLSHEVIARTRIARLLRGWAGRPAAALDELAQALIKVSQLIIDLGTVIDLRIDPLLADEHGVAVRHARLALGAAVPAAQRLAIRPYPKELEEEIRLPDGRTFLLRPVLPEDEPGFQDLFARLTPEDIRLRFFAPKKALSHPMAARLTQIDYDREMALVLAQPGTPGRSAIFGAVHINADPDGERAEFSIMLRSDMSGLGFGPLLMRRIIDYGRRRGLREIFGEVLRENRPMLRVCELFGFHRQASSDEPGTIEVRLRL
jgi:acetyltransferase